MVDFTEANLIYPTFHYKLYPGQFYHDIFFQLCITNNIEGRFIWFLFSLVLQNTFLSLNYLKSIKSCTKKKKINLVFLFYLTWFPQSIKYNKIVRFASERNLTLISHFRFSKKISFVGKRFRVFHKTSFCVLNAKIFLPPWYDRCLNHNLKKCQNIIWPKITNAYLIACCNCLKLISNTIFI